MVWSYAQKLGEAMQYTNFLRDVREDRLEHQRIYMPSERLESFGLTHDDIVLFSEQENSDARWISFCRSEILLTEHVYAESKK